MEQQTLRTKSTPRDVFSYLLLVIALVASVIAICSLLWQYINVLLPDPMLGYALQSASSIMRGAVSTLLVVWPVFLLMSWLIERDQAETPEKNEIRVRKWLLYFMLFVSAVTMMVDLISLVNTFLNGELTLRFGLKVLVILVVSGLVFGYYLHDLRREARSASSLPRQAAIVSTVLVLASMIAGFFVIGSPATQRALRIDEQRVRDMQDIQYRLVTYWQQTETLPQTLDALNDPIYGYAVPMDPSGVAYEYTVDGRLSFTLCATFERPSVDAAPEALRASTMDYFVHGAGRTCFDRTIDPALYQPIPKI